MQGGAGPWREMKVEGRRGMLGGTEMEEKCRRLMSDVGDDRWVFKDVEGGDHQVHVPLEWPSFPYTCDFD